MNVMRSLEATKLDEVLAGVMRPGRYIGNEWNVVRKDPAAADLRFALAFPDIYDIGMSYLGYRIIYGLLNQRSDVVCERVFAPWTDLEERMRALRVELFSLESRSLIRDFDIVGFSLTYELNYTNVLNMLDLAGIPVRRCERGPDLPVIIAGGPAAVNPAPMAEFIDAFVIGEGEEVLLEIVDLYKKLKSENPKLKADKDTFLRGLAHIEGVYVPAFPGVVTRRFVKDLENSFYPVHDLVPNIQIVHDRITLEIMRGCPYSCHFCQASAFYRPVRLRSPGKIIALARAIYAATGYDEISLLSLSSGSYPGIAQLAEGIMADFEGCGVGLSLSSLRSDDILKLLPSLIAKIRKTGLTFAPEAGSERLRRHINKNIDAEKIVAACAEAFKLGWRLVKLYFMIGLPSETAEDLQGIVDFVRRIQALTKSGEISVSVNAFVPKFNTAFAAEKPDLLQSLIEKEAFLRERLRDRRIKTTFHDPWLSLLEAQFNRPDERLAALIYGAWKNGAIFNAWGEHFNFEKWRGPLAENGISL
ncbi:MAG: radical SAM protein [Candidatus Omnitrophota bacterium]